MDQEINNQFYDTLGDRWYSAQDDPVALLRAESQLRNPWVAQRIAETQGTPSRILDIGCGGGFLSNFLARHGHQVTGIDLSEGSLEVARKYDQTGTVIYRSADAYQLPFPDQSFDVVSAMDFLEHVDQPNLIISEVSRVLKEGGLFFFHTFNRNFLSWLIVIKGVEWFVKNTPQNACLLTLFETKRTVENLSETKSDDPRTLGLSSSGLFTELLEDAPHKRSTEGFSLHLFSVSRIAYTGYAMKTKHAE